MWVMPIIGLLGSIIGFLLLTLGIASGLYYLSELVEEHTVTAKRLLTRLIYLVMALSLIVKLVDRLPLLPTLLNIFSHAVYLANMRKFPFVRLSDPLFLLSGVLVLLNHYIWFRFFTQLQTQAYSNPYSTADADLPSFTEIASYFGVCVWLVPFALFVSLSASDNVLPTMGNEMASGVGGAGGQQKRAQGMVKHLLDGAREGLGTLSALGRRDRGLD